MVTILLNIICNFTFFGNH